MSQISVENSFFKKKGKAATSYALWCGHPDEECRDPCNFTLTPKSKKISLKEFKKGRESVKQETSARRSKEPRERNQSVICPGIPRPRVSFHYQTPAENSKVNFLEVAQTMCSETHPTHRNVQSLEECRKQTTYLSLVMPNSSIQLLPSRSQEKLSPSKRMDEHSSEQDFGKDQALQHAVQSCGLNENQALQHLKESQKSLENIERIYDCLKAQEEPVQVEPECIENQKENIQKNSCLTKKVHCKSYAAQSALVSGRELQVGGKNKLQRHKYDKKSLFCQIRKVDTLMPDDDCESNQTLVSQVLEDYQGLWTKVREVKERKSRQCFGFARLAYP